MVDSIRTCEEQIKESQRIEYEIRLALEEERELNELKSRFVSMVSHELRTPLTILRTSIELLEQYGHLASDTEKNPKECSPAYVDPIPLRSILMNLLSNAIKYSSADQPIELILSCTSNMFIFKVQDHGIGIPNGLPFKKAKSCGTSCPVYGHEN